MGGRQIAPASPTEPAPLDTGTILVGRAGRVKILRSRKAEGDGWNCQDGAPIGDDDAADTEQWTAYTQEQLVADLVLARQVRDLSGHKALGGGIATWDACSGRPCILPKLARIVQRAERDGHADWSSVDWLPIESD